MASDSLDQEKAAGDYSVSQARPHGSGSATGPSAFCESECVSLCVVGIRAADGGESRTIPCLTLSHPNLCLTVTGFCVVGFDHRGQGKSEGLPTYIENIEQHLGDAQQFIRLVEKSYGSKIPKILTGLSMGGMTCYQLSLREPEKYLTAVMMAPILRPVQKPY